MDHITKHDLINQAKENLKDTLSLIILLENDLSEQREDEVYARTIQIVHQKISASIEALASSQQE